MKKTMYGKCLAVLVALSLFSQISVGAISIGDITTEPMEPIVPKTSLDLPLADIPEVLTAEQTVEAQNVERLRDEEETQNSAVFRNADGTNTLYLFSENIWYEDANGEKHDYNTKLTQGAQTGTYTSANAGGELILPQSVNATTPIRYTENGYTVTMYPVNERIGTGAEVMGGEGESRIAVAITEEETARINAINEAAAQAAGKTINAATLDAEANTVEYFRANADATMVTSVLLHGTKTGIFIESNNNIQSYSFVVNVDGLEPVQCGKTSLSLVDEKGDIQSYLNVEEITDSKGNKSFNNEIEYLTRVDGSLLVTVTPDVNFLAAAEYPSLFYIVYSGYNLEASAINDVDVSSYSPNTNYATASTLYVGRLNGYAYRSYFQLCFPAANRIVPGALVESYLHLYEGSTNTSVFYMDSEIPGNIWDYTSLTWNSSVNNNSTFQDPFNCVYAPTMIHISNNSQYYSINATSFVEGSLRNYKDVSLPATVHESRGFVFFLLTEDNASPATHLRIWNSTNHSSNKPYLSVKYLDDFGAATIYRIKDGETCNCFGYALEVNANKFLPDSFRGPKSEEELIDAVIEAASISVDSIRQIPSKSSFVDYNEYRIAMRIGFYPEGGNFHFIVQLNDGQWAQKFGGVHSSILGHIDPDVDGGLGYWSCVPDESVGVTGTGTIYFAVNPAGR